MFLKFSNRLRQVSLAQDLPWHLGERLLLGATVPNPLYPFILLSLFSLVQAMALPILGSMVHCD